MAALGLSDKSSETPHTRRLRQTSGYLRKEMRGNGFFDSSTRFYSPPLLLPAMGIVKKLEVNHTEGLTYSESFLQVRLPSEPSPVTRFLTVEPA